MALQTKEFIGSTGRPNLWTWKIIASEESANISTKTSVIKIESYIGRQPTAGGSYFMGTATLRYRAGGETRDIWYENWTTVNIGAGGWHKIGEETFTVSNTGTKADPTKITVSSELVGASFSPTTGSASGELTLTALHDAPTLNDVTCKEKNTLLTSVGVGDDYVVANLSIKEFTIDVDTYDGATVTKYEVINGEKVYDSTTNVVKVDFQKNELVTRYNELLERDVADLYIRITDDLGGVLQFVYPYTYIIPYTKPSIEKTSTTIKRKTGNGTVLTDNKALLNFVGTCYKGNDTVGNNNKPTVQYKIWGNNESEPSTYNTLTTPNVANVTIKDFEIGDLLYTEPYNYKIRIYDVFFKEETTITIKVDTLPTGVSVWSEYKDRVNFSKLTIKHKEVTPNEDVGKTATAWLSGDYNFPANQTQTIPFVNFETEAEDYFKLENNGIKVLKDCVVQVWLQWGTWGTYGRYAYIVLNNGDKESFVTTQSGTVATYMTLRCKSGDTIYGKCHAEGANGMSGTKNQSYIEVTILK